MAGEFKSCWQGIDISGAGLFGLFLAALAVLFYAIAVGTDHWSEADPDVNNIRSVEMGLFKYCERRCEQYVDDSFLGKPSSLNLVTRTEATAAFLLLGLIFTVISGVMIVFSLGREGFGETIFKAVFLQGFAGFMGLIAMAIWIDLDGDLPDRFDYGYSFALHVVAWIVNLFAGLLFYVDSRNISYKPAKQAVTTGGRGML
eukprot:m.22752 g.22752  ORF g.22752 m.22752 type:complete len:201 (+) comp12999_c0_seq1:52-654(+)